MTRVAGRPTAPAQRGGRPSARTTSGGSCWQAAITSNATTPTSPKARIGRVFDRQFAPGNQRLFDYDIERERIGFNANFEFRPDDSTLWYLRSIFNEFTDIEGRHQLDFDAARGDQTVISDTRVANEDGRASREYRQNNQTQQLNNISLVANSTLTTSPGAPATRSRTPRRSRPSASIGSTAPAAARFRIPLTYRTSSGNSMPAPAINDADNYPFRRVRRRSDAIEEDINSIKTDIKIERDFGSRSGYMKFGIKYAERDKSQDRENMNYEDAVAFTLGDTGLFNAGPNDFFDGRFDLGPILDFQGHEQFFIQNPGMFELDAEGSAENSVASDYNLVEDLYAAYGMLSIDFGTTTILTGARLEYTDAVYQATAINFDDPAFDPLNPGSPIQDRTNYFDVLPSIHVTFRPKDDVVIRLAWTNTIGRPNFEDVVPVLEIEDDEGSAGNVELEPFESMGFDFSYEKYLQPAGIISIGAFYKDIDNPIYTRRTPSVTFRGVPLISLSQPENAKSGTLLGLELNWEQQFVNLPEPWNGLGASANLTFVDSEVEVFGRESDDLTFFRQPDTIGNVALFYTTGRFEARLAASYRDSYLEGIGGEVSEDVYFSDHTQVDLKLTFNATDNLSIFGEVQNTNDESRREYQGRTSRLFADEIYSWTALVGATFAF